MLIYSEQPFIRKCFELNEWKKASTSFLFLFFEGGCFEWSHAEIGLRGEHIAPVRCCSGQQSASVVRYISLHPPSILPADMHTSSCRKQTNALSGASLEPQWSAIRENIFSSPVVCLREERAHACVFTREPAHTRNDAELWSVQPSGFVNTVRLNTATRCLEHTLVSERVWVVSLFFFFAVVVFSSRAAF